MPTEQGRHREGWSNQGETPQGSQPSKPPAQPRKRRWLIAVISCLLLVIGITLGVRSCSRASAKKKAAAAAAKGPPPIPVGAGTVTRKDVPIYLDGLGTVQAF